MANKKTDDITAKLGDIVKVFITLLRFSNTYLNGLLYESKWILLNGLFVL